MYGPRTIRNRISRAQRKKATVPAKGKLAGGYANLAMTSLITLSITAIFGDLIIKRNIEKYQIERSLFKDSPKDGAAAFDEARSSYNEKLDARRSQTQRIVNYITDNNVAAFAEFYPVYSESLNSWNENRDAMAKKIVAVTGCRKRYPATEEKSVRMAAVEPFFTWAMGLKSLASFFKEPSNQALANTARETAVSEELLCPTFFLTKESGHSVHSVFRKMNTRIYNYRFHPYNQCRLRHEQNVQEYYKVCVASSGASDPLPCLNTIDKKIQQGVFCEKGNFNLEEFKVYEKEFDELDFYWAVGDVFFKDFRRDFMLGYCAERVGFWGGLLGWSCESEVDNY